MVDIKEYFGNKSFVKAEHLAQPRIVTIDKVEERNLGSEGETEKKKLVCSFVDFDMELVLNITNSESVAEITGKTNTDDWTGHQIELYASIVETAGKFKGKPCVRVRKISEAPQGASHVDRLHGSENETR